MKFADLQDGDVINLSLEGDFVVERRMIGSYKYIEAYNKQSDICWSFEQDDEDEVGEWKITLLERKP
jgi:hypothetical protein